MQLFDKINQIYVIKSQHIELQQFFEISANFCQQKLKQLSDPECFGASNELEDLLLSAIIEKQLSDLPKQGEKGSGKNKAPPKDRKNRNNKKNMPGIEARMEIESTQPADGSEAQSGGTKLNQPPKDLFDIVCENLKMLRQIYQKIQTQLLHKLLPEFGEDLIELLNQMSELTGPAFTFSTNDFSHLPKSSLHAPILSFVVNLNHSLSTSVPSLDNALNQSAPNSRGQEFVK